MSFATVTNYGTLFLMFLGGAEGDGAQGILCVSQNKDPLISAVLNICVDLQKHGKNEI